MAGQGEYGIFLEPEAGELVRNGKGYIVASVGHEVGQVDYTVFTATDKYIRDNPKVIQPGPTWWPAPRNTCRTRPRPR